MDKKLAIKILKSFYDKSAPLSIRTALDTVIPELKESEDKKMLREIKRYIKEQGNKPIGLPNGTAAVADMLAWLEKQGEQIDSSNKEYWRGYREGKQEMLDKYSELEKQDEKPQGKSALEAVKEQTAEKADNQNCIKHTDKIEPKFKVGDYIERKDGLGCHAKIIFVGGNVYGCEKLIYQEDSSPFFEFMFKNQDEFQISSNFKQNPTDKVDTKFHEGDWVVSPNGVYWHIDAIQNGRYEVTADTGQCGNWPLDTNIYRLWTIQDAKDGDVLTNGKMIVIFKHFEEPSYRQHIVAYIGLDRGGDIQITDDTWKLGIDKAKPATKEQRALLFSKMKEAGYEFDFEKKELKKIGQKPADKTEPKFKVGDWIVGANSVLKIISLNDELNCYIAVTTNNEEVKIPYYFDDGKGHMCSYRLWTIQDAKDGDVLSDGTTIFIFKDLLSDGSVMSYCDYDTDSGESDAFCPLLTNLMCSKITPVTKEQRDALMKATADADYTFDFEKKELKKIEQKPTEWSEKTKGLDELETYILSIVPNRPLDAIKVDSKNIRFLINKEQHEQLEKAMTDAGYTFDAEKKELRKIDWNPQPGDTFRKKGTKSPIYHLCNKREDGINFGFVEERENGVAGGEISIFALKDEYELVERLKPIEKVIEEEFNKALQTKVKYNLAWSEEDVALLDSAIAFVEHSAFTTIGKGKNNVIDWLKHLKDRVQPQRESGERNKLLGKLEEWLDEYVSDLADVDTATLIGSFTNYLDGKLPKSIRPQKQWKPTEEQLDIIDMILTDEAMDDNVKSILKELKEQLKQL